MPLKPFIEQMMIALATNADEVLVEQAKDFRKNPGENEAAFFNHVNDRFNQG